MKVGWALLLLSHYLSIPAVMPTVHPGTRCAITGMSPIIGVRYKCAASIDFDVCAHPTTPPHPDPTRSTCWTAS